MTKKSLVLSLFFSLLLTSALSIPAEAQEKHAAVIKINDVITPAIADFISRSIEQATKENAVCLIIQMDTPGGLDLSMRDIIKDIMNAEIPVIVYVGPSGARAASAGAIITIAADIAAMAPGTNIGAAHPVAVGGGKMDRTMAEKVVNDAVAYVKSIAQKKGRNVDWAVRAVRDSVSIPETEALKLKVIDLIAKDLNELLEKIDGKTVEKPKGPIKLATKGLKIQEAGDGFPPALFGDPEQPEHRVYPDDDRNGGALFRIGPSGRHFPRGHRRHFSDPCLLCLPHSSRELCRRPAHYLGGLPLHCRN